ncbi:MULTISPECIES: zinc ribbon domain-containing protein [Burkholderia]|uniref:Zinc ribbon domain-containing protein n=1 Tax=Burkholderia contaminans TaxID=488447 RepID=A0A2S5DNH6_9BURK|nr:MULTISPECIES: zinc ribbon domain-containing protein [Burkholderia]EKS9800025.1 zinc ribbon domain-containing protein [Burkholderia cepacia]EKS9806388.1 zinc ribbon domain-containing protein [Burkholderia cepacia]EKS9813862.1 zinc ribbon domain-containing protein [Burkholderia cepacia]EKS9823757.1 zinc ribbon domain-containing protein [Burkholderia cepacia]EKS9828587.1 zinc ribbon domain-containing protein [Burkholderia cepacia]
MSTLDQAPVSGKFGLLRAAEAVTNWRALAMCAFALVASMLMVMLTIQVIGHSPVLGLLFVIATLAISLIGYSAVGIVLMRDAQGESVGFVDALLQATFSVHRLVGIGVLLVVGWILLLLALLIVFLVCKLPGVGPLLYAIAYPVAAIAAGAIFAGMGYVGYPLAAPAIWQGNSTLQTAARLLQIGRRQLLGVIVRMFGLLLLVGVLSAIVFGILGTGAAIASSISAATGTSPLGGLMGMSGLGRHAGTYGLGMDAAGGGFDYRSMAYLGAYGFGNGLLIAIGLVIPFLTFVNGTCLIYLQTVSGVDFSATEEKLSQHVADAKRHAEQARERAADHLAKARDSHAASAVGAAETASLPASAAESPAADEATACAQCHKPMAADDLFCGECGARRHA